MLLLEVLFLPSNLKYIVMPYAFKVTAKQNIGGGKGIAKGMSV